MLEDLVLNIEKMPKDQPPKPQGSKLILKSKVESNTLHSAIKLSLQIAQFFGFFPIYVNGASYRSLKVKWFYWRMAYSLTTIFVFHLLTICVVYRQIQDYNTILNIDGMIFALNAVVQSLIFFKLTIEWPDFLEEWHNVEHRISNVQTTGSLKNTLNLIVIAVLVLASVEHYVMNAFILKSSMEIATTYTEGMENYFMVRYESTLSFVGYAFWKGCILEFINMQMTFLWNYSDVFIMLIGSALKFKLNQLNHRIRSLNKMNVCNIQIWNSVRKDYLRIVCLCQSSNKRLSTLILVSFSINLYFLLKQIFKSLTKLKNSIEEAYFYISFVLIVMRMCCVIFFGSGIYDEWQELSILLQSVPSSAYNVEVERFIKTVTTYELVLSGRKFFSIRRSLILKIAGTIVTYELVMIQFYTEMLKSND